MVERLGLEIKFISGNEWARVDLFLNERGEKPQNIFYEFEGPAAPRNRPNGNFAVVAVLPYAMQHRLAIHCDAPVDFDLLAKMEENQQAWVRWHPKIFNVVSMSAEEELAPRLPVGKDAVVAFSGGLDSTFALHMHKRRMLGRRSLNLTAAILVHGFDIPIDEPEQFRAARDHAEAITSSYNVPLTTVRTNWRRLVGQTPWSKSFIFAICGVLHQLGSEFSAAVVAADSPYDNEPPGWGSNAVTNQMMGAGSSPIYFTGAGWSRIQKARELSHEEVVLSHLRVCWEHPESLGNCGNCEKCLRTKLNFLACGVESVPALGPMPYPEEIRCIPITHRAHERYKALLAEGNWESHPKIRQALKDLLRDTYDISRGLDVGDAIALPLRAFRSLTGDVCETAITCTPERHVAGHCLFGPDFVIPESGTYQVALATEQAEAQDTTDVVFDVYENHRTKTVLAERQLEPGDCEGGRAPGPALEFSACEGDVVEFRVYWSGRSRLRITGVRLKRLA